MYNAKHHYSGLWQFTDDPEINNSSENAFQRLSMNQQKDDNNNNDDENTVKFANNCTDKK